MSLPNLRPFDPKYDRETEGVLLAVFAPFGSDNALSTYPDGSTHSIAQHPLVHNLLKVAAKGVHVSALIDLADDDSYLVDIPACNPAEMQVTSVWKLDMTSPRTLAGFIGHASRKAPEAGLVLALEGHGAGYLPEIDARKLTSQCVTGDGQFQWRIEGGTANVFLSANGEPVVGQGAPLLPVPCPTLPGNSPVMSTYGLGAALKMAEEAGARKIAVIHFNNCFNLSAEVMHTVAPHAHYATGYANYNFFTAGETYPVVFEQLRIADAATQEQLATWFAFANRDLLGAKGNHPTMGGVVPLADMSQVAECIDDLSDALLASLRTATAADRPLVVGKIRQAIKDAQQYDTESTQELEAPDELTDLRSLAVELQKYDFGPCKVAATAQALALVLSGIQRYGSNDRPWTDLSVRWDFANKPLAMNIFLPDPLRMGLWDWRSPYYLDINPDPTKPLVQPHVIEFLKVTDWVDFIIEYHAGAKFVGLLPAAIPDFPVYNPGFKPPRPDHDNCPPPPTHNPGVNAGKR